MTSTPHGYGWVRDLPDQRDHQDTRPPIGALPTLVDLRTTGHLPPVYDQGQLGSCTANMAAAGLDYLHHQEHGDWITPSRLFIYYYERLIEGTVSSDSGAQIRDAIKVCAKMGAPPESEWPYRPRRFAVLPSPRVVADARKDVAVAYARVQRATAHWQQVLADGDPICIGISVYSSFESSEVAQTGVVPMPAPHEKLLGGHAVLVVGYDTHKAQWITRNSWGSGWGEGGYFRLPWAYTAQPGLASDFWTMTKAS